MENLFETKCNSKVKNFQIKKTISEVNKCRDDSLDFNSFNFAVLLLSFLPVLSDLCTDLILVVQYIYLGHKAWAIGTFFLVFFSSIITQFFSLRWHITDNSINTLIWVLHFFMLGIVHRYVLIIILGYKAYKSKNTSDIQKVYLDHSDLCILHLFESFLESTPQLVLQVYIIVMLNEWRLWTAFSAFTSFLSLSCALAAYSKSQRQARPNKKCISWTGLLLQAFWRAGMLLARITALVLGAYCFGHYIFLAIFLHWIAMSIWIIYQKTDFCESYLEEKIYNAVVGVIYCFCFFNLKEGQSRRRILAFYLITVFENLSWLTIFLMRFGKNFPRLAVFGFTSIIGGTVLGVACMLIYYRFCHPSGPIKISFTDNESSAQQSAKKYCLMSLRCLKRTQSDAQNNIPPKRYSKTLLNSPTFSSDSIIVIEENDENDAKVLKSEMEKKNSARPEVNVCQANGSKDKDDDSVKRRAICSTVHLIKLLESKADVDTNSDGSSNMAETYESVSEVLSAHDYENLCAVNIARERWGLRSWKAYSDIETHLHDDSVVSDVGQDTLTSTATTSDRSCCASQKLGERLKPDDFAELENDPKEIAVDGFSMESLPVTHPLGTLDPIYEEPEDLSVSTEPEVKVKRDSVSTLVATIDKIRLETPVSNRFRSSRRFHPRASCSAIT